MEREKMRDDWEPCIECTQQTMSKSNEKTMPANNKKQQNYACIE